MAYITRTTGTPTDRKKFTYSAWLKLANMEVYQRPIQNYVDGSNRGYILYHHNTDANPNVWFFYDRISSQINFQATSVAKYRDTNGFYHLVVRADTTQSTQADRYRVYINGEQIDLSISTNIGQNVDLGFNSPSANLRIGGQESGSEPWKGIMSHVHFCDGYSYAPTEFGSTDATTGEWKINTSPSVTYGNNGYFVFKDDNAVTDRSGQGNNFTLSGSITKTEDSPSNVFATFNPFSTKQSYSTTFSNGNNRFRHSQADNHNSCRSTLGFNSGKWYAEFKLVSSVSQSNCMVGIGNLNIATTNGDTAVNGLGGSGYQSGGILYRSGYSDISSLTTYAQNDIIGCACDFDNKMIYWYKNGTLLNGTGYAFTLNSGIANGDFYGFAVSGYQTSGDDVVFDANFGNGYFGSTQISSAGTNASGIGIFEYDVPTGYTALSTKGLNL